MPKRDVPKLFVDPGMIPKSCAECFAGEKYGCVGDVKCRILDEYFTGNTTPPHKERPDECPISELQEKHGHWEIVYHFSPYQRCSVCGHERPIMAGENVSEIWLYRHCPECGARMDGSDIEGYTPETGETT